MTFTVQQFLFCLYFTFLHCTWLLQDLEEGSADWGDFYYDEYNYGEEVDSSMLDDDTEEGDGVYEDITSPPPYLDLGDGRKRKQEEVDVWPNHNFKQEKEQDAADLNDIEIVEEEKEESRERGRGRIRGQGSRTGGSSLLVPPPLHLLLLLLTLPSLFLSFSSPAS